MSEGLTRAGEVVFSAVEGRCLDALAALLGRGRERSVAAAVKLSAPRGELLDAGARRMARSVTRFLTEEGGYADRPLLRDGRRASGRVWDGALGRGFAPRFTEASKRLWLQGSEQLPAFAAIDASEAGARRVAKVIRDMVVTDGTDTGDWVVYALAHEGLRAFRLAGAEEAQLQRRLRAGSPLASLLHPDASVRGEDLRAGFNRLVARDTVRIAECVEGRLARAWTSAARAAWSSRHSAEEQSRRWSALGRTMHAWLDTVDGARRMDLARPLVQTVTGVVTGLLRDGGEAARETLSATSGLRSLRERDELIAAVRAVVDVGGRLLRRRDELALERYGDERYEEAQVYVRDVDATLRPAQRRVEGAARALSGVVG